MFDRSSFVLAARVGYTVPFNVLEDYRFVGLQQTTPCDDGGCDNAAPLTEIDTDIKLPLTERYFLGGIGSFQLRGFKARSVGPRRAILRRKNVGGSIFYPVGTFYDDEKRMAICMDVPEGSLADGMPSENTQGNKNGRCNSINDKKLGDFDDLRETDVIGGNKFATVSLEYRFPISETVGLQAVLFVDTGNAFAEGQSLLDFGDWRYAWGGGLLWFSPFGPLQVVLGFPINPLSIEKSPVFEFSVGGFGN
jgi:outer membrane protein assembly factor BamA